MTHSEFSRSIQQGSGDDEWLDDADFGEILNEDEAEQEWAEAEEEYENEEIEAATNAEDDS